MSKQKEYPAETLNPAEAIMGFCSYLVSKGHNLTELTIDIERFCDANGIDPDSARDDFYEHIKHPDEKEK